MEFGAAQGVRARVTRPGPGVMLPRGDSRFFLASFGHVGTPLARMSRAFGAWGRASMYTHLRTRSHAMALWCAVSDNIGTSLYSD